MQDSISVAGDIIDMDPTYDQTAWMIFLNYYFWMQACMDYQLGEVLGTNQGSTGGLKNSAFWNNTVIIFTSDHGEYGGSHGLHAKGGALYDEVMNIPLYISFPNSTLTGRQMSSLPRSFTCSTVDILPLVYSLVLGNESWRCDSTDMVNYLSGRESLLDAIFLPLGTGTPPPQQRRLSPFPLLNPPCLGAPQPYVLHTNDEYFYYNNSTTNLPPHVVAFRTVDNTVGGSPSQQGPFGGGKLGIYSNWDSNLNPATNNNTQQFEFYNYQPNALKSDGTSLGLNPGEMGNDYWTSYQSLPGQAYKYISAYNPSPTSAPYQTGELAVIYPQIQNAYANAFNLWQTYNFGVPLGSPPPGITCTGSCFTISLTNPSVSAPPGGSPNPEPFVNITALNGFSTPVNLSASVPANVTVTFGTNPVPPGQSSNVTITVASSVPHMTTYYIRITASGGGLTQIAVITLMVT